MNQFNIRVYGLWITDGKVLVSKEKIRGQSILKFPGGGLEFGEGTIDCLKREFMEELQIPINVNDHFYTTDFFQPSAYDSSQVISIYYLISPAMPFELPVINDREHFFQLEINEALTASISLPIDKIVAEMLQNENINRHKTYLK